MRMTFKLFEYLRSCDRCPWCGKIPRVKYSTSRKPRLPLTIHNKNITEKVARTVRDNSENKTALLENSPGGPYLTDAFGDVGFKQIFVTGPVRGIKSSKVIEVEKDDIFSFENMKITSQSKVEESICNRISKKSWTDEPVISVFGLLQQPQDKLLVYFIRKLVTLSGIYAAGRVEWFLFLPPSKARTILCGRGKCGLDFIYHSGDVINVLYDVIDFDFRQYSVAEENVAQVLSTLMVLLLMPCTMSSSVPLLDGVGIKALPLFLFLHSSFIIPDVCPSVGELSVNDFSRRFKTGPFQKQVQIDDMVLTKESVPLVKLVPKRDLFNIIQPQDVWPFRLFIKQVLNRRYIRMIPLMEKFVPGCGLRMIDMGYTMVDEVWQIKPEQFLQLYVSLVSWPEFQGSVLQSHLKETSVALTEYLAETSIIEEEHIHTDNKDKETYR